MGLVGWEPHRPGLGNYLGSCYYLTASVPDERTAWAVRFFCAGFFLIVLVLWLIAGGVRTYWLLMRCLRRYFKAGITFGLIVFFPPNWLQCPALRYV